MSAPQTSALAPAPAKPDVLVLGCGISGLSCGILLARLGHRVTIWAKELPPHTTSNAAAAVWWPYLSKSEKVGGWGQMSLHYYQHYMLPEPESGVMACFAKEVFVEKMGDDKIPAWAASFPSFRRLKPEEIPAGYVDGWGLESVVIHSDVALQYLVRKFRDQYKGTIVKREVKTPAEALNACPIVVNCTGLGSRTLFNDHLLYPMRGQILRIRHTGLKATVFDDHDPARGVCYVVPRQNDIIIGGTAQANNWDTKISKRDTEEIKRRAVRNFPELANMEVLEVKVGLRPARSEIRVETEAFDGGKRIVVHNYGHGGSGWTVAWGCGMEVCQLINEALPSLQAHSKL